MGIYVSKDDTGIYLTIFIYRYTKIKVFRLYFECGIKIMYRIRIGVLLF